VNASNVVVAYNGQACGGAPVTSISDNAADDQSCSFALEDVHPLFGTLFDQGGPTPTYIINPTSNAANEIIDMGNCDGPPLDQRGASRSDPLGTCDIGAYEFDGLAQAQIPDCTRTGEIPFNVTAPPASGVEALQYKVDGGGQQTFGFSGGATANGMLTIPAEGRHPLEYWADTFPVGPDGGEFNHHTPVVVVDRTNPTVAVKNPNKYNVFVIKRGVKVNVNAADSISGLKANPTGAAGISTARRGAATYKPTAVDLCDNAATGAFNYRVLAPALGTRLVVEELSGKAEVRASAKFRALSVPRELRIKSLVDSRKAKVRVTVSQNSKGGIQDGEFSGGLFQVRQSAKRSAKGLTELRLTGANFAGCPAPVQASSSGVGDDIAKAAARRVVRRLRGNGKGRFRTRGRYSAATVRGTAWTVEDRCDGTLTRVSRGSVSVRDFARGRTVVVKAGRSYLARAR
jgi:hypothetical protein